MSAKSGRRRVQIDQAGALETMQGVASQALPADIIPTDDDPAEAWATYVNSARGKTAAAVVEWGRRVAAAHAAYKAQGQSWGRTWDDWCRDNLGIGRGFANQLRLIGENLAVTNCQILPASTDQLTQLARFRRDYPEAFDAAAESGTISPSLTREQAQSLFKAAMTTPALPAAEEPPRPQQRRIAGILWETDQADKFLALAASRNQKPAQVVSEIMRAWVDSQPMPEVITIVNVTAQES